MRQIAKIFKEDFDSGSIDEQINKYLRQHRTNSTVKTLFTE